jgi:hypothetical protein
MSPLHHVPSTLCPYTLCPYTLCPYTIHFFVIFASAMNSHIMRPRLVPFYNVLTNALHLVAHYHVFHHVHLHHEHLHPVLIHSVLTYALCDVLNYYVLLNHVPISARLHYIPSTIRSATPSPYTFYHRRMCSL